MTRDIAEGAGIAPKPLQSHRALFLSDLHLGAPGCRAERLHDFLAEHTAETIYLVGDVLDLWHPLVVQWDARHDRILGLLRARAEAGARVVYLAGNHDAAMLARAGRLAGGLEICAEAVHEGPGGQRFVVLHGDVCDARLLRCHAMTRLGSRLESALRVIDQRLRGLRRNLRSDRRSAIASLLRWVGAMLAFGTRHERRLVELARRGGHHGVICGHFHKPALHSRHGIVYANCGDWVDSLTAIAEDRSGRLHLLRCADVAAPALAEAVEAGEAETAQWVGQ